MGPGGMNVNGGTSDGGFCWGQLQQNWDELLWRSRSWLVEVGPGWMNFTGGGSWWDELLWRSWWRWVGPGRIKFRSNFSTEADGDGIPVEILVDMRSGWRWDPSGDPDGDPGGDEILVEIPVEMRSGWRWDPSGGEIPVRSRWSGDEILVEVRSGGDEILVSPLLSRAAPAEALLVTLAGPHPVRNPWMTPG
ncbi:hypothetical protein DV515_00019990, partial [Chloebia gouldiae]